MAMFLLNKILKVNAEAHKKLLSNVKCTQGFISNKCHFRIGAALDLGPQQKGEKSISVSALN